MAIGEDGTGTVKGYKIGPRAQLKKAKLAGANLYDADLTGADLSFANLRGANLQFAILMEANLYGADLAGANFCHANLADANMENTNLAGAYFYCARVSDRGVALIEETHKEMMESLTTDVPPDYDSEDFQGIDTHGEADDGSERTPNPGRRLVVEVRYVGGGGHSMGIPRYCVVDAAAPANRMMGPGGHYSESYAIATFDNRATAEEYIDMVNGERTENPGQGTRRGPHGYKY